jgi:hypothetical protein
MPLPLTNGATVTIRRQGVTGTDRYGDAEYGTIESVVVNDCAIAPGVRDEEHRNGRMAVVSGLQVYLPAVVQLTALDLVDVNGRTYRVEGEPAVWTSPYTGITRGVVLTLNRVEG